LTERPALGGKAITACGAGGINRWKEEKREGQGKQFIQEGKRLYPEGNNKGQDARKKHSVDEKELLLKGDSSLNKMDKRGKSEGRFLILQRAAAS